MIEHYGWSETLQQSFMAFEAAGHIPGRVIVQTRGLYRIVCREGELAATLSGRFMHDAAEGGYPVAGDWVALSARANEGTATVHAVLPRASAFVRRASGPTVGKQVVAANVDTALLVNALNSDFSTRRIERYLATTYASGADPVIVLTKSDCCNDIDARLRDVEAIAFGVPVHAVSALTGDGMGAIAALLAPGKTAALLGSSGVGKSTLLNALAGRQAMATQAIRERDETGRHTTTHRELVLLPSGALMLDTPGMRELGLWDVDEGVATAFSDIATIASGCRFSDCRHQNEPGCAVHEAIAAGTLGEDRLEGYRKLNRELAWLDRKDDPVAREEERKVWIRRNKNYRARMKHRDKDSFG